MYEAPQIPVDPDQLAEDCFDAMATWFPGWEPDENSVEVRMFRTLAAVIGGPLATLLVSEFERIFGRFGEVVFGLNPQEAAAATAETTWTAIDNAGYTIPAGTQVAIATSGDTTVGFRVLSDVSIPAGSTSTAAGEVVIEAVIAGSDANGLTGDPELIDALTWVDSIVQTTTATSGGEDAELPDEYLNRLSDTLRLLSQNAVLPQDVEVLALQVPGVARALALDTYDPDTDTYDNEKMLGVAALDEDGGAVGSPIKDAIEALLALHREAQFIFNAFDRTSNAIKVDVDVVPRAGFDAAGVDAAVTQAITDYLDPANWGVPGINEDYPGGWKNQTVVRRTELIALVENVDSVDHISGSLQLALEAGSLGTADVTLVGEAPLTSAGTITVDVV